MEVIECEEGGILPLHDLYGLKTLIRIVVSKDKMSIESCISKFARSISLLKNFQILFCSNKNYISK